MILQHQIIEPATVRYLLVTGERQSASPLLQPYRLSQAQACSHAPLLGGARTEGSED